MTEMTWCHKTFLGHETELLHKPYDMHLVGIRRGDAEISADIIQEIPRVKLIWA
jgi:hypothetical protein